ncbi:DUF262 domain-containing protein [Amycolatopsis balhimycina DSM 5908]|uniref:DUF262 domain-containing protein n=2 Tax=Amycolatopsis balhimycina TaxID=208443 RepID=A0A428WQX7_AMYBA|nr:DUF262 domain-containing protein [Amycolatopsis balhimycina DSM 5908]
MIPLTKLFSQDFFFRIPEYQRPFLWDDEDFTNLIDDLDSAQRDEPYFLGTLVLHKSRDGEYDVVDGQQRLTALCILLACMRDSLATTDDNTLTLEIHEKIFQAAKKLDSIPSRNRLQVKDQAVFNAMIGTPGGTSQPLADSELKNAISRRYESARSVFWEKLHAMREQDRESFAIFVTQNCTLIYVATDTFEDAFRLFTVVNDRGKQLRRIDVLKAYNLDPSYVTTADSRAKYALQWEEMENQLGETQFENIFSLLRLIYIKEKPQFDLHKEFEQKILGQPKMPKPGPEFLDQLEKYVDLYDALFVDRDYLDPAGDAPHVAYQTLMEAMVTYFSASEWKACVLAFAAKFDNCRLYDFVLLIEKIYLDHWVAGTRKDERYGVYTSILKNIDKATTPDEIVAEITISTSKIEDACRAQNFYTASHAKYLLVRAEIVADELDHARHFQVRSIEHVLPQTPKKGGRWDTAFSRSEREELTDSAGNLVLLSKSKNSKASNREFEQKKVTYLKDRVTSFPRSVQVLEYEEWTPEIIRARTETFSATVLRDPHTKP